MEYRMLLDIDHDCFIPSGHDIAALGTGYNSDCGSDVAGLFAGDIALATDAYDPDSRHDRYIGLPGSPDEADAEDLDADDLTADETLTSEYGSDPDAVEEDDEDEDEAVSGAATVDGGQTLAEGNRGGRSGREGVH